jgi:FtsZ-interacting cell division protein ZipA
MLYITGAQIGLIVVIAFVVVVVILLVGFWRSAPRRWNGPIARRIRARSERRDDAESPS